MSKAEDRILGHGAEADGIEEYDNPLPDWWLGMFYLCIIWAFGYGIHYHFIGNRSQVKALAAEVQSAAQRWPISARATAQFVLDDESVAAGETVFTNFCAMCHGADLKGGIGPSFLDDEWLHGTTSAEIIATITDGVPAKGMISWGPVLSPLEINHAAAYVMAKAGLSPE